MKLAMPHRLATSHQMEAVALYLRLRSRVLGRVRGRAPQAPVRKRPFDNHLEGSSEQTWDIALTQWTDPINFPLMEFYTSLALNGPMDWVTEEPDLRWLSAQVSRTLDRAHQERLIRQMERHTHDQAYFLFLYNPIQLFAVNKAVEFVPHATTLLNFVETTVTEQHWSIRKQKAAVYE